MSKTSLSDDRGLDETNAESSQVEAAAAPAVEPAPPAVETETVALTVHQATIDELAAQSSAAIANLEAVHKLALNQALGDLADEKKRSIALRDAIQTQMFAAPDWLAWLIAHRDQATAIWGLVQEWESITQPITDKDGLKARVLVAVKAAKLISSLTPSPLDDEIVAFAEMVLVTDGGLDIIVELLFQLIPHWQQAGGFGIAQGGRQIHPGCVAMLNDAFRAEHLETIKMRATDRRFDFQKIIGMLPAIISVINLFAKL